MTFLQVLAEDWAMGVAERRNRDRAVREKRITAAARQIAASEGWGAVTIRRLADEIEYSQPVLYSHFANRDAIVAAVAVEGFRDLAAKIHKAVQGDANNAEAPRKAALAYMDFARESPALYEAMFSMPTGLQFSEGDIEPELREAFAALAAVVAPRASDVDMTTETFWAALHGLAELERSGRIAHDLRNQRVSLVVDCLLQHRSRENGTAQAG
jgi:AcrR family transcriptional regulator